MINHIVTAETSHALKEAGYPQPEQEPGQFWYLESSLLMVCKWAVMGGEMQLVFVCGEPASKDPTQLSYAPTATEILDTPEMFPYLITKEGGKWKCRTYSDAATSHANPAEAAAAEYLKLKKQ